MSSTKRVVTCAGFGTRQRPVVLVEEVLLGNAAVGQRFVEQARNLRRSRARGFDIRRVLGGDAALGDELDELLRYLEEGLAALHRRLEHALGAAHAAFERAHLAVQAGADAGSARPPA